MMQAGDILSAYVGDFGITVVEVTSVNPDGTVSMLQENYPEDDAQALQKLAEYEARPELDLPSAKTLAVDEVWTVPDLPEGSRVATDGQEVGTIGSDNKLEISFPEAGSWVVEIWPPYPWHPTKTEVTVI